MRNHVWSGFGAVLLVFTLFAADAAAGTHPHSRKGFFMGLGLGGGIASVDLVDVSDEDTEGGGVVFLRLGGAIRDDLILGLETSGWVKEETVNGVSSDWTLGHVSAALTWFPGNMGVYLRGGVGLAFSSIESRGAGIRVTNEEQGFAVIGALGYEWRVTPSFALGPQIEYDYLHIDGDYVNRGGYTSLSLQLNWYW